MDTFRINKNNKKQDFIEFIKNGCKRKVTTNKNNWIVDNAKIFVIFGKSYIRVQDSETEPHKITQLFYNTSLDLDKYASKMSEIILSSISRTKKLETIQSMRKSCLSLLKKFAVNNKYTYEPYTLDDESEFDQLINETSENNDLDHIYTISSENNFSLTVFMNNDGKLVYNPKMDYRILSKLMSSTTEDTSEYIQMVDTISKKIEKLKKVMALIINDIDTAFEKI